MGGAGGWLGVGVGGALHHLIGMAGALVVLLAAAVLGTMLVTDTSLPELIDIVRRRVGSLNEARDEARRARDERDEEIGRAHV